MTQSTTVPGAHVDPIDCEIAIRRLWDYLDGRLGALARDEMDAHLATCELCPAHFAFAKQMRAALAASAEPRLGGSDEAQLRDRVRQALARIGMVDEPRDPPGG